MDAEAREIVSSWTVAFFVDPLFRFNVLLRVNEYLVNRRATILLRFIPKLWFRRLSIRLGFSIPLNVFGPGLAIVHYGLLVVSPFAEVGRNCRVHAGVNIGGAAGKFDAVQAKSMAPKIGDRCYIGPGAKIFGPARIGDGCAIGANAVVNALVCGEGVTVAGNPARIVSSEGSRGLIRGIADGGADSREEPSG